MSQRYIFASVRIGNFDDARRSNDGANACETRRSERNIFVTSNDASIVARDVRGAPRGVAQIGRYILWHVIGELTVVPQARNQLDDTLLLFRKGVGK